MKKKKSKSKSKYIVVAIIIAIAFGLSSNLWKSPKQIQQELDSPEMLDKLQRQLTGERIKSIYGEAKHTWNVVVDTDVESDELRSFCVPLGKRFVAGPAMDGWQQINLTFKEKHILKSGEIIFLNNIAFLSIVDRQWMWAHTHGETGQFIYFDLNGNTISR